MTDSTKPGDDDCEVNGPTLKSSDGLEFSDFTIICNDYEFKVHRSILFARSTYFKKLVAGVFREAQTQEATLPEDDPALIARLLIYMYSGSYPEKAVSEFDRSISQFSGLEDNYAGSSKCDLRFLHISMYALAVKLCDEDLKEYAIDHFIELWYEQDDESHYENCCLKALCEDEDSIFRTQRILYEGIPANERALRDVVVISTQSEISTDTTKLMGDRRFRDALCSLPEFCVDLIAHPFTSQMVKCSECCDILPAISGMCDCRDWAHKCKSDCFQKILAERSCRTLACEGELQLVIKKPIRKV